MHTCKLMTVVFLWFGAHCAIASEQLKVFSSDPNKQIIVDVALPLDYDLSERIYPVIYLFDGPGYFTLVTEYNRKLHQAHRVPEAIVVSIPNKNRYEYFVGKKSPDFSKFVTQNLSAAVSSKYRTNGLNIGVGHSLGASFLLKLMSGDSQFFQYLSISSPVISDRFELSVDALTKIITNYCKGGNKLFLSKGNETGVYEKTIPALAENLKSSCVGFEAFENDTHASVSLIAPYFGLSFLFNDFLPPNISNVGALNSLSKIDAVGGYSGISSYYEKLSKTAPYSAHIPDILISRIGFTYIDEGRFEDLLTLIQKEGKDRSRLISYLSNRLVSLGETKTALALLQIDKSINPSIDLNHERLSELINNQKAMKH